jgi:hypothetical protein
LNTDDIIYLKKACRIGYESHGLDIPRLNEIVNTLQEKAEKWDNFPPCNHSCDCTDCQIRCVRCTVELKTQNLEQENQQHKETVEKIREIMQEHEGGITNDK